MPIRSLWWQSALVAGVPVIVVLLPATSVTVTLTEMAPAASELASMHPTVTWPSPAWAEPLTLVVPSESVTVTVSDGSGASLKATPTLTQDALPGVIVLSGGPSTSAATGAGGACVSLISEPETLVVLPFASVTVTTMGSVPSGSPLRSRLFQITWSPPPDCTGKLESPPTESEIWSPGSVGASNDATIVADVWVAELTYPAGLESPAGTPTLVGPVGPDGFLARSLPVRAWLTLPLASVSVILRMTVPSGRSDRSSGPSETSWLPGTTSTGYGVPCRSRS